MNDEDLETLLRRYRPLGPPEALRGQIMAAVPLSGPRLRDWLPAVAAVILAVVFSWLAGVERQRLSASLVAPIEQHTPLDYEEPLR
jgi:hypothetical protein